MEISKNKISPNIHLTFLQAIEYPDYARSEFFIKEQLKSGWSRDVYLSTLLRVYESYKIKLDIYSSKEKNELAKKGRKLPDDFGLDLAQETNGIQKGKLDKKVLEDLAYAVRQAYKIDKPKPEFNSYEIIAFCERILIFIRSQFEEQIKKTGIAHVIAEQHKKEGGEIKGVPVYRIYHYSIISDAPIADYYQFRNEIRKLLLTSQNPEELETILRPLFDLSVKIVDLWNSKLHFIEEPKVEPNEDTETAIREQRLITFDHQKLEIWNKNIFDDDDFLRETTVHFFNRDLAVFASRVANLISGEVLKDWNKYKLKEKKYASFDELFIDSSIAGKCYKLLIDEQFIDTDFNYRGNLKSIACLWVKELGRASLIIHQKDSVYLDLLNKKFKGLNLSLAVFRKHSGKAKQLHERNFRVQLSQIAQLSHKSEL